MCKLLHECTNCSEFGRDYLVKGGFCRFSYRVECVDVVGARLVKCEVK